MLTFPNSHLHLFVVVPRKQRDLACLKMSLSLQPPPLNSKNKYAIHVEATYYTVILISSQHHFLLHIYFVC